MVENFHNIKESVHVGIALICKQVLLTFFVFLGKFKEELNGSWLKNLFMSLKIVEAETGPVGDLNQTLVLLVEAERIVMEFLGVGNWPVDL